jgi:hypothetical protein
MSKFTDEKTITKFSFVKKVINEINARPQDFELSDSYRMVHKPTNMIFWLSRGVERLSLPYCVEFNFIERWLFRKAVNRWSLKQALNEMGANNE